MKTDLLPNWLAHEAEVITRMVQGAGPGVAKPEQVAGLNGLEMMQAMLHGSIPYASIAKTLDFYLMEVSKGRAVFQGKPGPAHLNPMGTIHGGWYATLLDSALGCAVHTMLEAGVGYGTVDLNVKMLKAVPVDTPLVAIGRVLHVSRTLGVSEGTLQTEDGTLLAHATATCFIRRP